MFRLAWAVFAAAFISALGWASAARADVYSGRWMTLQSEHFTLYYHAGLDEIAPDVLSMCEQAHALVTATLATTPPDRTHVVLVDTVDAANGSAGVVPRNAMQLLAMPPESDSVLGYYENWMWNLVVHEYTHIVQIDSMGAGFRALNRPFGKRFAPNQLLPRWFIEGLATWQESEHSSRGRVNSVRFRGILDAAALGSTIPDIGDLSGVPVDWPGATGWYLYGSFFIDWIARTHGDEALAAFVEQYGRRALPLGVNIVARDNFGASFEELWEQWREVARTEAQERLGRRGDLTPWEPVTSNGYDSDRVVGDGRRVAWLVDDGRTRRRIEERGPDGSRTIPLEESASFALLGGDSLIVSQSRSTGRAGAFRDLHVINGRGRFDRITRRARAREPAASPDGSLIVYVRPAAGRTDLVLFDVESGEHEVLVEAVRWGQVATPRFSPDGATVVFSYLVPGEGRDLYTVELATGALTRLTSTDATELDPSYTPDGSCVLYSADHDAAFDIYAHNLETGEERRLSTSATGAYHPAPWIDGETKWLYASVVTARGYDIVRVEVDSFCGTEPVRVAFEAGEPVLPQPADLVDGRRFREGRAFVPLRWTPTLAAAGSDVAFGASLGGGDPAGLWTWDASALWTTQLDTWAAAMGLGTRRLPVDLYVYAASQAYQRNQSMIAQSRYVPYVERNTLITPSFSVPFNGRRVSRSITAAYTFQLVGYEQSPVFRHLPWDIEPVMPLIGRLDGWSLNLSLADTATYADSISTEAGWTFSSGIRLRRRALGSLTDATEVTAGGRGYIPLWGRLVLAGRLSGGWNAEGRGAGRYGIGGPSAQDVLVALRYNAPGGTANVRGFVPQLQGGRLYGLGSGELRFPLLDFDWGAGTFPLQLSRLSGAVFVDAGSAFDELDAIEPLVGVGAEVRVDATLGYFRGAGFRAGFARGVLGPGIWDVYAVYGWGF